LYVPKVSGIVLKELHEAGQTISQLAAKTGIDESRIISRIKKADTGNVEVDSLGEVMEIVAGIIGREAVIRLCLALGSSMLYIPKADKEIAKEIYLNSELHPVQIAALCSCSLRTVYRAIEGLPPRNTPTGKTAPRPMVI
jgi:transcriptional antiterminator